MLNFNLTSLKAGAEPQTSALEIIMSELTETPPLSPPGSPWSGDSDRSFKELDQFNLDASKKRDCTENESKGVICSARKNTIRDSYSYRTRSDMEVLDDGFKR
ncbi:hypothetical protein HRI_003514300 [Hibiscus trionum]|uniref:Uncharacterized protein n=1 Tax=Hibiscus trionum TaxID=183268 RepID=A0A9W7MHS6_HIBTR|nr:hypothetical protein HRI_003514300 [Hibiscus trionum]